MPVFRAAGTTVSANGWRTLLRRIHLLLFGRRFDYRGVQRRNLHFGFHLPRNSTERLLRNPIYNLLPIVHSSLGVRARRRLPCRLLELGAVHEQRLHQHQPRAFLQLSVRLLRRSFAQSLSLSFTFPQRFSFSKPLSISFPQPFSVRFSFSLSFSFTRPYPFPSPHRSPSSDPVAKPEPLSIGFSFSLAQRFCFPFSKR